jgi:cell fate regulator YaaT (PSP1 superfamily)
MADSVTIAAPENGVEAIPAMPRSLDEARAMARERFKERLTKGEKIGDCACGDTEDEAAAANGPRVVGVRFLDSGRVYYFHPGKHELETGDWVVVETSRGREAGRVVLAPHQVLQSSLQGDLKPILRRLSSEDMERMNRLKGETAQAIRTFSAKVREYGLRMKPISAEYNFDGSHLLFSFSAPERIDFRDLAKDLSGSFHCRVELRQVGPRDEARLLGGVGRCGRTLCCSSWLPIYPEISMNMAKTQDLPLNPSKVSGVCGRLLCCLSYENEQYKQMKATMPRLAQSIETPIGPGMVVSMQILKDLVTVRLAADNTDHVFHAADLGFRKPEPVAPPVAVAVVPVFEAPVVEDVDEGETGEESGEGPAAQGTEAGEAKSGRRRRRRGRGGRRRPDSQPKPQA